MKDQHNSRVVWTIAIAAILVILGSGVATVVRFYRICSWSDFQEYGYMSKNCNPVWREFHYQRVGPGSDFAELVKLHPTEVRETGEFARAFWSDEKGKFTEIRVTAYQGKLIEAAAYTTYDGVPYFEKTFFDLQTAEQVEQIANGFRSQ